MSFDLPKLARAAQGLFFAGGTFVCISMVLVVPALMQASNALLLHLAALIVGIQAAQSSVIQVGRSLDSALGGKPWLLSVPAMLLAAVETWTATDSVVDAILATTSGSFLGLMFGRSGLLILEGKGGTAFQSFQAARAAGLVAASAAAALIERQIPELGPLGGTAAIAILAFLQPRVGRRRAGFSSPRPLTSGAGVSVTLGLLTALFYRNDVNWIRTSLATSSEFIVWHYALVAYGAVQGIVGFIVVQFFFANRQKWKHRIHRWSHRYGVGFAILWAIIVVAAASTVPLLPVVASVLCCSLFAGVVGLISGLAHVVELSWVPYVAGVLGAGILVVSLTSHIDARMAILIENAVIGSVIICLVIIFRRRPCNSFN